MSWLEIVEKVKSLPPGLKKDVEEYFEKKLLRFLKASNKQPVFGSAKGMFVIKPNFDEPLEDFEDYMS